MMGGRQIDAIFTARRVHTMSGAPQEAFACRGGIVRATGSVADLKQRLPTLTVHDFGDATVVPGFNDAHAHPTIVAEQLLQLDVSPAAAPTYSAMSDRIRAACDDARSDAAHWVVGFGYDPARTSGGPELDRHQLDAMCPDVPVLIVHMTLHSGVTNTAGLRRANLRSITDAPPGTLNTGSDGDLSGVLHDQALYDLAFPAFTKRSTIVPPPDSSALRRAFREVVSALHSVGITSVTDALLSPMWWEILCGLDTAGELTVRLNGLGSFEHFDKFATIQQLPKPDRHVRLTGIKTFADGAVNGGHCLVEEPVIGSDGHGVARVSRAELISIVSEVHRAGWPVCIHANGDRAVRYALDGIESAQAENPRSDARHRIEHVSVLNDVLIRRMRELDVVAVPFGQYPLAHGDKLRSYYRPATIERMFAHRSLLDAGVPTAGSSDYPCGPLPPLTALESLVNRKDRHGVAFGDSQRIEPIEALRCYTIGAAFASSDETWKGQLAPGYVADFVVLEGDPVATEPSAISGISVRETWVGGRRAWPDP